MAKGSNLPWTTKLVSSSFPCLLLDAKGLDTLADEAVGEILLAVGKAGPGLVLDQKLAGREACLQEHAGAVADDGDDLAAS